MTPATAPSNAVMQALSGERTLLSLKCDLIEVVEYLRKNLPEGTGVDSHLDFFRDGWRFNAYREDDVRVSLVARGNVVAHAGRTPFLFAAPPDQRDYKMTFPPEDAPLYYGPDGKEEHAVRVLHAAFVSDTGIPVMDLWGV